MAIAFDVLSQSADVSGVSSVSWSHTVTGTDPFLFVGAANIDYVTLSGVTYNGTAMTTAWDHQPLAGQNSGSTLAGPATGSNTVAVTWTGTVSSGGRAAAASYSGVHQTVPTGAGVTANGSASPATRSVSSAAGEMVIDFPLAFGNIGVGAGQTARMDETGWIAGSSAAGFSEEAGAATVTMSWTISPSDFWATGAIALKPAGAAATTKRYTLTTLGVG